MFPGGFFLQVRCDSKDGSSKNQQPEGEIHLRSRGQARNLAQTRTRYKQTLSRDRLPVPTPLKGKKHQQEHCLSF